MLSCFISAEYWKTASYSISTLPNCEEYSYHIRWLSLHQCGWWCHSSLLVAVQVRLPQLCVSAHDASRIFILWILSGSELAHVRCEHRYIYILGWYRSCNSIYLWHIMQHLSIEVIMIRQRSTELLLKRLMVLSTILVVLLIRLVWYKQNLYGRALTIVYLLLTYSSAPWVLSLELFRPHSINHAE